MNTNNTTKWLFPMLTACAGLALSGCVSHRYHTRHHVYESQPTVVTTEASYLATPMVETLHAPVYVETVHEPVYVETFREPVYVEHYREPVYRRAPVFHHGSHHKAPPRHHVEKRHEPTRSHHGETKMTAPKPTKSTSKPHATVREKTPRPQTVAGKTSTRTQSTRPSQARAKPANSGRKTTTMRRDVGSSRNHGRLKPL